MYYNKDIWKIAEHINKVISYNTRFAPDQLTDWFDLIDVIAELMECDNDKKDWYNLCNTISPEESDESCIS